MLSRLSLAVLSAGVLFAGTASAVPVVLVDQVASGLVNTGAGDGDPTPATWYGPHNVGTGSGSYSQTISSGPSWAIGKTANFGDIIGGDEFDIQSLTITRSSDSITFAIRTKYSGSDAYGTESADIFIDTGTPTTPDSWNYGIALGSDYTRGTVAVGFYKFSSPGDYLTSNQVWKNQGGFGIGGLIQLCTPGDNACTGPAAGQDGVAVAPATVVNGGEKVGNAVDISRVLGGDGYYTLSVTVTDTDLSVFDSFDVLTASADCANDALWGQVQTESVPAPGALALVGFGLIALAGVRRRAAK